MDRPLTIGQLADVSGVTAATIRYYERLRLLPLPARTRAGYRLYPRDAVNRLRLIRNAQRFGFSLEQIGGFLRVKDAGGRPCRNVRAEAQRVLDAVDAQIAGLIATRREMRRTLRDWDRSLAVTPESELARLLERLASQRGRRIHQGGSVMKRNSFRKGSSDASSDAPEPSK